MQIAFHNPPKGKSRTTFVISLVRKNIMTNKSHFHLQLETYLRPVQLSCIVFVEDAQQN